MPACFKRRAQAADMHIHRPFFDEDVIAPYLIEKQGAAMHALRVCHEEMEQAELGWAQIVVAACVKAGALPLVVGGGHDCSYGNYLGLCEATGRAAVIAVDAHLDVRPLHTPSSGNPFFRMLEHGLPGERLAAVELVPWVNASAHRAYAEAKGARLHFLEPGGGMAMVGRAQEALAAFQAQQLPVLATFDLDVFGAAHAPGVSAVNPWGLSADAGLALAQVLGACPAVVCLDLMELAPPLDPDGRTSRFAAFLAAAFLQASLGRQ